MAESPSRKKGTVNRLIDAEELIRKIDSLPPWLQIAGKDHTAEVLVRSDLHELRVEACNRVDKIMRGNFSLYGIVAVAIFCFVLVTRCLWFKDYYNAAFYTGIGGALIFFFFSIRPFFTVQQKISLTKYQSCIFSDLAEIGFWLGRGWEQKNQKQIMDICMRVLDHDVDLIKRMEKVGALETKSYRQFLADKIRIMKRFRMIDPKLSNEQLFARVQV